jgi:DNA-directed RNA polymerase subunit RPC12/RpoP
MTEIWQKCADCGKMEGEKHFSEDKRWRCKDCYYAHLKNEERKDKI